MKESVTVLPIAIVVCLLAQPGAADDENRIDFFESKISGTQIISNSADS